MACILKEPSTHVIFVIFINFDVTRHFPELLQFQALCVWGRLGGFVCNVCTFTYVLVSNVVVVCMSASCVIGVACGRGYVFLSMDVWVFRYPMRMCVIVYSRVY